MNRRLPVLLIWTVFFGVAGCAAAPAVGTAPFAVRLSFREEMKNAGNAESIKSRILAALKEKNIPLAAAEKNPLEFSGRAVGSLNKSAPTIGPDICTYTVVVEFNLRDPAEPGRPLVKGRFPVSSKDFTPEAAAERAFASVAGRILGKAMPVLLARMEASKTEEEPPAPEAEEFYLGE